MTRAVGLMGVNGSRHSIAATRPRPRIWLRRHHWPRQIRQRGCQLQPEERGAVGVGGQVARAQDVGVEAGPVGLGDRGLRPRRAGGRRIGLRGGGERELGEHPETGERVVLKSGRYGPYISAGERNASLLPAGITAVRGQFSSGEPVELEGPDGMVVARGLVNYDSDELPALLGRSTRELAAELGPGYDRTVVHRDALVVIEHVEAGA